MVAPVIKQRFRGFLPIVVDVETGGLNPQTDALLEVAAVAVDYNERGRFEPTVNFHDHVLPFEGAVIDPKALEINRIDPDHPFRFAQDEKIALKKLFAFVEDLLRKHECKRAILVGHNAWFDLAFLNAAIARCDLKSPFHQFTSFDTATLAGLAVGHTVLAEALRKSKISFDANEAHSALYDAVKTAELFCKIVNQWDEL